MNPKDVIVFECDKCNWSFHAAACCDSCLKDKTYYLVNSLQHTLDLPNQTWRDSSTNYYIDSHQSALDCWGCRKPEYKWGYFTLFDGKEVKEFIPFGDNRIKALYRSST